jgi:PAS domain S-box-containing protein
MNKYLNKLLINYKKEDFAIQLKARFVLIFSFIMMIMISIATIYSTLLANSFDIVIFPLTILFLIVMFSLIVLIKGQYLIAVHIILSSGFMITWIILFFEPVSAINQTNTIVYIIALLSATPFLLSENKIPLIIYFGINIIIFLFFCYYLSIYDILQKIDLVDYLLDSSIAIIFVFAISYSIYSINQKLLYKINEDLIEKKQAAKTLSKIRLLLSNIINAMPSVIIGINHNFIVTNWNKETEKISGISSKQAEGSDLFAVFPQLNSLKENLRRVIQNGIVKKSERIKIKWGEENKYVDIIMYPLFQDDVEGAVVRIDDVSESVKMEDMMIQSEKMITLGGLATGMAHEINNPLAGIIQSAQLALNRLTQKRSVNINIAKRIGITIEDIHKFIEKRKIADMLNSICHQGERIAKIVEELLSFSNPSSSQSLFKKIPDIVEKSITLTNNDYELKTKYNFNHINIIRKYDPELPEIQFSETKILQVFLTLLKNSTISIFSREYNNNEQPQIIIRAKQENQNVRVEVEDNGNGIPKKVLNRIFEPFFTTMPVGQGAGLGLYISYFIITKYHGGSIQVESKPNISTKFIIRLPLTNENKYGKWN